MMLKHLPRLGASYTGVLQLECLSFVPLLQAASFVNHDQVKKLTDMGLKAAFVGEAQDDQFFFSLACSDKMLCSIDYDSHE